MYNYIKPLNLSLPTTSFPMRACLVDVEPKLISRWYNEYIYKAIRYTKKTKKVYYIHDGPPYANGQIHIGHAVNKTLKDIIIKSKELMGYNCIYIPGWDCHGLPIEIKLEYILYKLSIQYNTISFYTYCIKYASKQVFIQKESFIRLGVICGWERAYLTMSNAVISNAIRTLSKVSNKTYLYRDNKPVYWCFRCLSSLAEAEIEYRSHLTNSVYILFKTIDTKKIASIFGLYKTNSKYSNEPISLIAWTTTTWSIPANQAVAVNPNIVYQLIKTETSYYILASCLAYNTMKKLNIVSWVLIGSVKGNHLESIRTYHPIKSSIVPVVLSEYVTADVGTGLVHIASAHGLEDYYIGKRYALNRISIVSEQGSYIIDSCLLDSCYILHGLSIYKPNSKATNNIEALLVNNSSLLYMDSIAHDYPYCWRHKEAVIYRTTPQWFIKTNSISLVKRTIHSINNISWVPKWGQERMGSMIVNRPDWCISRQRSWGTPIPIYTHSKPNDIHPRTSELLDKAAILTEIYGIEAWHMVDRSLGNNMHMHMHPTISHYNKCSSILDVWFESGAAYYYLIGKLSLKFGVKLPDLCLEGSDQYRGWFMVLLILANIITEDLPYRESLTHGFVVDADGFKMSKSIGNVINPLSLIEVYGADVFRIWVSLNDFTKEVQVSEEAIKRSSDIYRRIRNTIRFLLASLTGFHSKRSAISFKDMLELDRWLISCAYRVQKDIIDAYNRYLFHIVIKRVMQYCSIELGAYYIDIVKDRSYTASVKSNAHMSCLTAIYHILEAMVLWVSPIVSFTAYEICGYKYGERDSYIYSEEWHSCLSFASLNMDKPYWNIMMYVRSEANKVIELERLRGLIGSSLEVCAALYVDDGLAFKLLKLGNELPFLLLVSETIILNYNEADKVAVQNNIAEVLKVSIKKASGIRCFRCWHYTSESNICNRCVSNLIGVGERRLSI
ncbi:isoleucine--tRNA ligase [Candidatus Tremblaya phenacola]|uniref:Isoleucine--tRNA ligase n=1 Tax=Candidatus Tremblayella phenacoccinincola TaxID=1010676 RepID=A0A2G0V729_9PROT|nr:isoleucine--tRNA ligase [Candidatus Tremblaya phenacola]PHN16281.1 Isoleucine--tRNA ligase [Candidatus Tremblaya phenacola]